MHLEKIHNVEPRFKRDENNKFVCMFENCFYANKYKTILVSHIKRIHKNNQVFADNDQIKQDEYDLICKFCY